MPGGSGPPSGQAPALASLRRARELRVLLYPANLTREDEESIRHDDAGVIWLGRKAEARSEPVHAND